MREKHVLVVCHLGRHYRKFGYYDIRTFSEAGYKVSFAANFSESEQDRVDADSLTLINLPFKRRPIEYANLTSLVKLYHIIKDKKYTFVHCESPVGGVITRIACIFAGYKNVYYTAHGFHFYRGAPVVNWILYFPIEFILNLFTKKTIVINQEDFLLAKRLFINKSIFYLPGIGLNVANVVNTRICRGEKNINFSDNDIVIISVGELSKRKNQIVLLKAMDYLNKTGLLRKFSIKTLIVGTGDDEKYLRTYVANHGLSEIVVLLGQRKDVRSLLELSDIYVSTSRMEGLPISVLEAMDAKLPLILSNCRGNRELVEEGYNGYLFQFDEYKTLAERIVEMAVDRKKRMEYGEASYKKVDMYRFENIKTDIKRAFDLS